MKKLAFTFIVLTLLFITSCSSNDDNFETLDAKDVFFTYPSKNVRSFTVDDDGSVYSLEENKVTVFDLNGGQVLSYDLDTIGSINRICIGSDMLYFTAMAYDETEILYCYDMKTNEQEELISLVSFSKLKQIVYVNGLIYISGINPDYVNKEYGLWDGDVGSANPYVYDGTVLGAYNISENRFDIVFDQMPNSFAVTPSGKIMLYAYDSEGGYYFAELEPESGNIGDKQYTDIKNITSFTVDNLGGLVLWPSASKTSSFNTLSYISLKNDLGVADVMPHVITFNDGIKFKKGFTFYHNAESKSIERIKNSVYVKDNPKIKMMSAGTYATDIFSAGYQVEFNELEYEEFALTVLSLDKKYDISYMNSRQDFSLNIKNKGSFYPLNDVPNVKEFIDGCFSYIREVATDDNGDIWMIPIDVSIPVIIYQEENCKEAGLDFAGAANVYDMIDLAERARNMDQLLSFFNDNSFIQKSISLYLRNYTTPDTPDFRLLAPALSKFNSNSAYFGDSLAISEYVFNRNPGFLFSTEGTRIHQTLDYIMERNDFKAVSLTGSDYINSAYCTFLCVNPNSDNLNSTLEYISSLCEYMMTINNSYMFTDELKYTDSSYARELYALYENSVIDFNVSNEVFASDFERYLNGKVNLDTLIEESDRKLAIYLNE